MIGALIAYSTWTPETSTIAYVLSPIADGYSLGSLLVLVLIAMHSSVGSSGNYMGV